MEIRGELLSNKHCSSEPGRCSDAAQRMHAKLSLGMALALVHVLPSKVCATAEIGSQVPEYMKCRMSNRQEQKTESLTITLAGGLGSAEP